ncbi:nucleotidyltransferase family protein [Geodermatophilus aquaeductus]|uniref:Nucleotidyltransferase family protein n=1 Tax=Geodermatophilus aquaeductus TaxID=1564161 RepID=A0A521DH45_9ACTN|nr:nucleotidyltransferase family protein [Geodermatophilus aquaeductus]SMO71037.1 hypothetical protein SAMN06273567_103207 [Geodermatophilus aquaeductus]
MPEEEFLRLVLADPTVAAVLERTPALGVGDWWVTAGLLFQTAWNALTGRPPGTGIRDADLFYLDADPSWAAEDARPSCRVPTRACERWGGRRVLTQARVHLWYGGHFGTAAPPPFRDCAQAIDAFAAVCCAVGVTVEDGRPRLYAPYGVDDLLGLVVRPNPRSPAPRAVYEAKAARWRSVWPELTVLPWA